MKKRLLIGMFAAAMTFGLAACGGNKVGTIVNHDTSEGTTATGTTSTRDDKTTERSDKKVEEALEEAAEEMVAEEIEEYEPTAEALEAYQRLLAGNGIFLTGDIEPNVVEDLRHDLVTNGQHPYAVVVTCSDSRVPAEHIFNAGLGEIFVIRTAGNVVGDFEVGSVEYGAEHLGSPLVLVMGHTNCGAVTAAVEGGEAGGKIQKIVNEIAPSVKAARDMNVSEEELLGKSIELNVQNSIKRINESHIMKELQEEGHVAIMGCVYDITTGTVSLVD